ncbi:keratin, type I cytoskeletal 18-like [Scleropages formosus]|uniref:Keratin, type I cytoskeletal 18-like n=1 Tax=Scleropages formosus TaxID=113540 RepID=A0A0P7WPE2_SCLFO|nr:keratin, type I cytoskeletal 18-like [Scleropages formosus]
MSAAAPWHAHLRRSPSSRGSPLRSPAKLHHRPASIIIIMSFSSASATGGPSHRAPLYSARSLFGTPGRTPSRASLRPPGDDKQTLKGLNERLAGYLSQVRQLEESNISLEERIQEILLKRKSVSERDWDAHERPLDELRAQVRNLTMENARLILQIDNSSLAAEDFAIKRDSERALRQAVEQDMASLTKATEETQLRCEQLQSEINFVKEELEELEKNHKEEVTTLRSQISDTNIRVEMESPKDHDLSDTINKIRTQYEKAAEKNRKDTALWYQNKFDNITAEEKQNTEALQTDNRELSELRRQKMKLEIELQALQNMIKALEKTLNDTENRNAQELHRLNLIIQQLEAELGELRTQLERQAAMYQALLNTKMKLENEIGVYRGHLENLCEDER